MSKSNIYGNHVAHDPIPVLDLDNVRITLVWDTVEYFNRPVVEVAGYAYDLRDGTREWKTPDTKFQMREALNSLARYISEVKFGRTEVEIPNDHWLSDSMPF